MFENLKNILSISCKKIYKSKSLKKDSYIYRQKGEVKNHLFICGLHRSGTTLLENYIHANFQVSVLRANVPENEGQHLQKIYSPALKYGGPGHFAFESAMNLEYVDPSHAKYIKQELMSSWGQYIVGDDDILSEKSPPNLTKINWLRSVFPKAKFIIFVRDPRAVAGATKKWSKTSVEELVMHWNVAHSIAIESFQEDCYIVKYEDFCDNPHDSLVKSGITDFLTLRETPLSTDDRFTNIQNSNNKYYSLHKCKKYGRGAWEYFGYNI